MRNYIFRSNVQDVQVLAVGSTSVSAGHPYSHRSSTVPEFAQERREYRKVG